jgi:exopolysaccharide biosynthesis operon protein EpsL
MLGAWLWHVTPRISGVLSASRSETLVPYSDQRTVTLSRSTQINENRQFTFDGEVAAAWHIVGGLGQSRSRNSQPFTQVGDYEQNGAEAGLKYISTAGNSIAVVQRESRGDYEGRALDPVNFLDTGFDQSETEARVQWRVSGHTSLDGRLGYLKREHNNFGQRNYSGAVGKLDYLWTPTGKLQLTVSAGRNLYSFQDGNSSYYLADAFAVAPAWLLSDKTTLRMKFEHVERDFRGAVAATLPAREDRTQSLQFGADWKATRTILVQGTLSHERRSSNIANFDYRANVVGISGQLMF